MNYIVLDMEWNQAFTNKRMVRTPVVLYGEIIQIGAVKLDENFQMVDFFKIGVRPQYYVKMHKKVKALTRITNGVFRNGLAFPVALSYFRIWCGEDAVFLTWGSDDMDILRDNMTLHQMSHKGLPKAYNLQHIFDAQIAKRGHVMSLKKAMALIEAPGRKAHDALNDAINTAEICKHLDMEKGLAEYDDILDSIELSSERVNGPCIECVESETLYRSKTHALADVALTTFYSKHYDCQVVCEVPFKQNKMKYIAKGTLASGETVFVRFRFKRMDDDQYQVVRIIHEWNAENDAYYDSRREKNLLKCARALEFSYEESGTARLSGIMCSQTV